MDDVKIHYNSSKPSQLYAHAYAQGTDVHMASGNEEQLPHEAWHVVQQKQGRVKPTMQMKGKVNINDDVGLEKEADVLGVKAMKTRNNEEIMSKTLILITGHPNSGKTTIRTLLKEKLMEEDEWYEIDYDSTIQMLMKASTQEDFRKARSAFFGLLVSSVKDNKKNIISDVLIDTPTMKDLKRELKEYGITNVITVVLHCNPATRIIRDAIRKEKNYKAVDGFNDGLENSIDTSVFDFIIDTSLKKPQEVVREIYCGISG